MYKICNIFREFHILVKGRYFSLMVFLALTIAIAFLEAVSVGSIYPLISLLIDPAKKISYYDITCSFLPFDISIQMFVVILFLVVLASFLAKNVLLILSYYLQHLIAQLLRVRWQTLIFDTYLKKNYTFFVVNQAGDLIQKQMVHTHNCLEAVVAICAQLRDLFSITLILGVLALISWKAVLVLVGFGGVFSLVFAIVTRIKVHREACEYYDLQGFLYSLTAEIISGMREVKMFVAEKYFSDLFHTRAYRQAKIYIRLLAINQIPAPIMQMMAVTVIMFVLGVGAFTGHSDIALVPLVAVLGGGLYRLISLAAGFNSYMLQLGRVLPSVGIVADLLKEAHCEIADKEPHAYEWNNEFSLIIDSFSYPKSSGSQVQNIHLTFEKGKFYAIVGPSGCGKSTLMDLLVGLYEVDSVRIYADGTLIDGGKLLSWRQSIAVVSQHPFIFNGTVAENIAFAINQEHVDQVRLDQAIDMAGFRDVLARLPDGQNSFVGEKGYRLSGGERQRLAIARAIYRDSAVYIFDEATSALDSKSERKIQEAINALVRARKTLIVIAHRLSTVVNADAIIVMDAGRINDVDNHKNLMKKNSLYRNLYLMQTKETTEKD